MVVHGSEWYSAIARLGKTLSHGQNLVFFSNQRDFKGNIENIEVKKTKKRISLICSEQYLFRDLPGRSAILGGALEKSIGRVNGRGPLEPLVEPLEICHRREFPSSMVFFRAPFTRVIKCPH